MTGRLDLRIAVAGWTLPIGLAGLCATAGLLAGVDPQLAVVVALAVGLVMLAFANLTAGVVALVLLAFLDRFPLAGPTLSLTRIAALLLGLSWLMWAASRDIRRDHILFTAHPWGAYLLVLFVGWATVSGSWAESSYETLSDLLRLVLGVGLFVVVFSAVRTRAQAAWVIGAFIAGATLTSLIGLIFQPTAPDSVRATATIGEPNVLAAVLIAGFALALAATLALRRHSGLRLLTAGAATACLMTFFFTGSRGGLVALTAALLTGIVFGGRWRWRIAAAGMAVAILGAIYISVFAPDEIRDRIASTTVGETRTTDARASVWRVATRMIEDRPITGVGFGNFQEKSAEYALEPGQLFRSDQVIDNPQVAHNIYLHIGAELGLVGLAIFLGVLGFALGSAARAARSFERSGDAAMEIVSRGVVVALCGLLAADFFLSEHFSKELWLLLGLGPALLGLARREAEPPADPTQAGRPVSADEAAYSAS